MTDCITFCVDNTIPTKTAQCFTNNKPQITSVLKELLNKKKRTFRDGDRDKLQWELRVSLRESKDAHKWKLENKNNIREVWSGMKQIMGLRTRKNRQRAAWIGAIS